MSNRKYVVVNEVDSGFIQCHVITDNYYEAVGKTCCLVSDNDDRTIEAGYKLTDKSDFEELEGGTGWGWFRTFQHEPVDGKSFLRYESWYLLKCDEEEQG